MTFALLLGAGRGTRLQGADSLKVLQLVGSDTVLVRSLKALTAGAALKRVIVLAPQDHLAEFQELCRSAHPEVPCDVIAGGASRRASVLNGVRYLREHCKISDDDLVLVHDAARCFVTPDIVSRCVEAALTKHAVTCAIPLIDSVKEVRSDLKVERSLDRGALWAVQTPQVFRYELLRKAHEEVLEDATDDASLVEKLHPVWVVEGESENFKITTNLDLAFARFLVGRSGLKGS